MAFELGKFLENPDVLYMMAGMGSAMAGKDNPFGASAGLLTMAGIKAENQRKLLAEILGQGGDIKMNKDKVTINAPPGAFQTADPSKLATGQGAQGVAAPAPAPGATPTAGGSAATPNHSVGLPDFSKISLAGLTPEDIRGALQIGLASEEIKRKSIADASQSKYWEEMAETQGIYRRAMADKASVPPDTRTSEIKNYEYAVSQGFKGDMIAFKKDMESMPNSWQEWNLTDKSVPYGKWIMDRARAGAINLGEIGPRAAAGVEGKAEGEAASYPKSQFSDDLRKARGTMDFIATVNKLADKYPTWPEEKIQAQATLDTAKALLRGKGWNIVGQDADPKNPGTVILKLERGGVRDESKVDLR